MYISCHWYLVEMYTVSSLVVGIVRFTTQPMLGDHDKPTKGQQTGDRPQQTGDRPQLTESDTRPQRKVYSIPSSLVTEQALGWPGSSEGDKRGLLEYIRENEIGRDKPFLSPFGTRNSGKES